MMNAQILTKTLVPPGQTTPSIQGKPSGSSPSPLQGTHTDSSDPTAQPKATSHNMTDDKSESTSDPNGFKRALTKKMAKTDADQPSEETVSEQPSPAEETVQALGLQSQSPISLKASLAESLAAPAEGVSESGSSEQQPAHDGSLQMTAGTDILRQTQTPQGQIPGTVTGQQTSVQDPALQSAVVSNTTEEGASVGAEVPGQNQSSVPSQEIEAGQNPDVTAPQMQRPGQPAASLQTSEAVATSESRSDTAQAAVQMTAQSEETSGQQNPGPSAQQTAVTKETVLPKETSEAVKPPVIDASVGQPEGKPAETANAGSLPQQAVQQATAEVRSLEVSPAERIAEADVSEPDQVLQPLHQTGAGVPDPSHQSNADVSDTPAPTEAAQGATPIMGISETQAASEAPEVVMFRSPESTPNSVARQIQNTIALGVQQNSNQIVIRLDPPELGQVAIRFQEDSQGITGVLEVQRPQTRADIQQALPEIVQQLQDSGVQIKRVEVLLSADSDRETFEDQAFAQAQDQDLEHQQTSDQDRTRHNNTYGLPSLQGQSATDPTQEQYVSNQGINLLI